MSAGVCIYLATLSDGTHLAATNESPYLCFQAESEEAVKAKVKAALEFYDVKRDTQRASVTTEQNITQLLPTSVIASEELGVSV